MQNHSLIKSIVVFLLATLSVISNAQENQIDTALEQTETQTKLDKPSPLPLDQIRAFTNIYMRIKHNYVTEVSDEELMAYAIEGMLNGLDPHSAYLKEEKLEDLDQDTSGKFGGLGVEVMMEDGYVKVITPIDDTPAAEAGILSGDVIIQIDGQTIRGENLNEATKKMRGEPGTPVSVTVVRESEPQPLHFDLVREVVNLVSVRSQKLDENVAYIRVSQFQLNTAAAFRKQLKKMRDEGTLSGLIIDLRNNPGGLLLSAISMADAFIEEGVLVSTKGRHEENSQTFEATANDMLNGKPIVVLINEGSASASEIVAGALQDHGRALILGTESFGKGSVQSVMEIDDKQSIKLTTGRYYTPNGRSIQAAGIVPDVLVTDREFKEKKNMRQRIKEENLGGHLENENSVSRNEGASRPHELLAKDYQLNEAYNILQGLILFHKEDQAQVSVN